MTEKKDNNKTAKSKKNGVKTVKKRIAKKEIEEVKEDKEIKKIANSCNYCKSSTCCVLLVLFVFVLLLIITMMAKNFWFNSYRINMNKSSFNSNVLIVNNGDVKKTINNDSFNESKQAVITNINSIELTTDNNSNGKGSIKFDVKYEINKNTFKKNAFATANSNVIVKFSYSFDRVNWFYTNNALSTSETAINPLTGNCYDIAGVIGTIKVSTNNILAARGNESKIIYWRSETIFQKPEDSISGDFDAVFKIEYKNN